MCARVADWWFITLLGGNKPACTYLARTLLVKAEQLLKYLVRATKRLINN